MTGRLPGRGARINPANRFTLLEVAPDREQVGHGDDGESPDPRTLYLKDTSRQVIATNDSPDVGFDASINPYRGCECGCAFCYARPFHEYLGFSAGVDFETRILVKDRAAELLRAELSSPSWQPRWLALSGVTDPYQPVERKLRVTRGVLEVLAEFRNPVGIVTKNHLVTRDLDLLQELAAHAAVSVSVSITTLDAGLQRRMEPRASSPDRRLAAIATLAGAGVPVGVITAPLIPGLNDQEIPRILEAAAEAGARFAWKVMLRLPHAVKDVFLEWLERNYPERKERVLNRIREVRGGRLNAPRFGTRRTGDGVYAEQIEALFETARRRLGLGGRPGLSSAAFRRPARAQAGRFDG